MRRFFIYPSNINGCNVNITGSEARHLSQVLRLSTGHSIELFDGEGTIYQATISAITKSVVETVIVSHKKVEEKAPLLSLGQALLKGKKMDLVFQKATELGLYSVQPMITRYSIRKVVTDNQLKRWQRIAFESCKQCGRPTIMKCEPSTEYKDVVIRQAAAFDTKLIFWEDEGDASLHDLTNQSWGNSVFMLIGPEGGFSQEEVDFAISQGFTAMSLGQRILRAETAAISAMAIVQFLLDTPKPATQAGDKQCVR